MTISPGDNFSDYTGAKKTVKETNSCNSISSTTLVIVE